jgi:hypothetical protein
MAEDKKAEEKAPESGEAVKEQPAAKPELPASARKPGQNYASSKFKK